MIALRQLTIAVWLAASCAPAAAQVAAPVLGLRPPFELAGWRIPPTHEACSCFAEFDLDGDGDLDLFLGKLDAPSELWLREAGSFRADAGRLSGQIFGVTAAVAGDFDGDGWSDLYLARAFTGHFHWPGNDSTAGWDRLYLNRPDASGTRGLVNATWGIGRDIVAALSQPSLANLPHFPLTAAFPILRVGELRFSQDALARDLDGDGDLDIVLAHGGIDPLVRRREQPEPFVLALENAIYWNVGDTNGDGVPNFIDDPRGTFEHDDPDTPIVEAADDISTAVAAGDFDGDGDLDLLFANLCTDSSVHLGNLVSGATNRYYEALARPGGGLRYLNRSYRAFGPQAPAEESVDLLVADLEGTGALDLVVLNFQDARAQGGLNHPNRRYRWDPAGRRFLEEPAAFARVSFGAEELRAALTAFDLEADGDLDLLVGGTRPVLLENRAGSFARLQIEDLAHRHESRGALAVGADRDGDALADRGVIPEWIAVAGVREQCRLFQPLGGGLIDATVSNLPLDVGDTLDGVAADLDGDGGQDLVLAQGVGGLRVWMNRGVRGYVSEIQRLPTSVGAPVAVVAGDFDGQPGIDLALLDARGAHRLLLNDGAGNFTPGIHPLPADPQGAGLLHGRLLAHDFDVDGRLDLMLVRAVDSGGVPAVAPVRFWRGLGGGAMCDESQRLPGGAVAAARAAALIDVDGDGDRDVVFVSDERAGLGARLWLVDSGFFRDASGNLPTERLRAFAIAADDVDGDGRPDLYLGLHRSPSTRVSDRVWAAGPDLDGDGIPNFRVDTSAAILASSSSSPELPSTHSVCFCDTDGDGDRDLLIGQPLASSRRYERISPNIWLRPAPFPVQHAASIELLLPVDFDGDGLLDILVAGNTQARLFVNRSR